MNYFRKIQISIFIILLTFLVGSFVLANEAEFIAANPQFHINLDQATIAKGYTVAAFSDQLKLSLVPGILSESTGVLMEEIVEDMPTPWQMDKISRIYQFEFKNKDAYDNHKPFYIQFSYEEETNNHKQVFFYDKNFSSWRPLPTRDYPEEKFVRSLIHLPFARIAVFSNPEAMTIGRASWYAYKGGNFAASPDFLKGSLVRVHNPENGKYVDVTINDYGPDRKLHPDRAIDLDKVAFSQIASLGSGIIDVWLEPLEIKPDNQGRVLGVSEPGITSELNISSKAAVVMLENSKEIIWEKQATSTLPLASLTKLVAIKVFLDTRPSLDRVVAYSIQDEEYNYEYCAKWESARVKLDNNDMLTIEDLLYSTLVGSANNTIETLVRVGGLTRDKFIEKMNTTVSDWGAVNTHFVEPSGLSPENVSSALDYAIITKEVYTHPIIKKASIMPSYEFYTINTEKWHRIRNTNQLIAINKLHITGSKTGYLDEAGYCLMTRVDLGYDQIIVVTLGAPTRDISFSETEDLIKYIKRKIEN